jgi:hypothetical protein
MLRIAEAQATGSSSVPRRPQGAYSTEELFAKVLPSSMVEEYILPVDLLEGAEAI